MKHKSTHLLITVFLFIYQITLEAQIYRCQVEVNGFWGYIDERGEIVIKPIYQRTQPFSSDGIALVKKLESTQWEIIDINGNRIQTEVSTFELKGPKFNYGMIAIKVNGKWGYMNSKGKVVIPPIYNSATSWGENGGIVKRKKDFYVVDSNGKEIPIQDSRIIDAEPFFEGLASIKTNFGTEGFINPEGKMIISPRYKRVGNFSGGLAWVKNEIGQIMYINKEGNKAFNRIFDAAKDFDPVSKMALVKENGQWKYLSNRGGVTEILLESYGNFSSGLAYGRTSSGVGFIDNHGTWVIQPQFRAVRDFVNGFACASSVDFWGIIDESGAWIIPPKFKAMKDMERID